MLRGFLSGAALHSRILAPSACPAVTETAARTHVTTVTAPSVYKDEATKFAALADQWWSATGPFAPLHAFNVARVHFLRTALCATRGLDPRQPAPFSGLRVLDVGCGGGILSESLGRLGAQVTGIDVTADNVAAAQAHAAHDPVLRGRIRYEAVSAEEVAARGQRWDVVVASEVIEHVRQPQEFVKVLRSLAQDEGGQVAVSTISRTPKSLLLAVGAAEYVLGIVPPGTHRWSRFITPEELALMGTAAGLKLRCVAGLSSVQPTRSWSLSDDLAVNYIALLEPGQQ